MRKTAVAIGAAAAKGDLRENWEYKSALEERDRLVERATRVRDEFDRARVISPADISGDEVNVGTTIELRDMASGEELTVTFLGPWDADIENGVYSYFAPLSLRFMGRKAGDRVRATFGDRTEAEYEIRTIERAV
jgi:transcription elongation GreA/GreB family factor